MNVAGDGIGSMPSTDGLTHEEIANSLIRHLGSLPRGSVIGVQGTWGRGKTDILTRVHSSLANAASSSQVPMPAWINPWQYGAPDLLSPLVLELTKRVDPAVRQKSTRLRQAAKTLLRVGSTIAIQGASVVVPVLGPLMSGAAAPVDEFINGLFEEETTETPYDSVKAMADAFRVLVDQYQRLTNSTGHPLVILVDDLDRCLPDHQIAILESIHFLTSAGADCHFLIAIDPQLVAQAAISHYKVAAFDTEQFLDKLFDLRISLQYLRSEQTLPFFKMLLKNEVGRAISAKQLNRLATTFPRVFVVPALNNPRVMTRVARRIQLLLAEIEHDWLDSDDNTFALLSWASICERWPSLRIVFQVLNTRTVDARSLFDIVSSISDRFRGELDTPQESDPGLRPIIARLPAVDREPDLAIFLNTILSESSDKVKDDRSWMVRKWVELDAEMCRAAL
jgi:hypothetical protein